jgi:hypothetical protein
MPFLDDEGVDDDAHPAQIAQELRGSVLHWALDGGCDEADDLPILLGDQGTNVLRGDAQQPLFEPRREAVCLRDVEQIGVEGGLVERAVEPATGETVTVGSAGNPDEDIHHGPVVTSLDGSGKPADQTCDCRSRGTRSVTKATAVWSAGIAGAITPEEAGPHGVVLAPQRPYFADRAGRDRQSQASRWGRRW